jgi:hypothetical protein
MTPRSEGRDNPESERGASETSILRHDTTAAMAMAEGSRKSRLPAKHGSRAGPRAFAPLTWSEKGVGHGGGVLKFKSNPCGRPERITPTKSMAMDLSNIAVDQ